MKTDKLEIIGKGTFSTCYKLNYKQVLIKSTDPIKECMGMGWFPDSRFFPKVERLEYQVYVMPLFERVTAPKKQLNEADYNLYLQLKCLKVGYIKNANMLNDAWIKQFKTLKNKTIRTALIEAMDACCNYGSDINFEISPRNIAVKNGKLILLDCFFSVSALNEKRSKSKKY